MAESNLNWIKVASEDISVFPVAKKRIEKRMSDGLLYEDHIADITNNIVDYNYIIDYTADKITEKDGKTKCDGYIIFILDGYRIKISNFNTLVNDNFKDASKIVAMLNIDSTNETSIDVKELAGDSFESDAYVFGGVLLEGRDSGASVGEGEFVIANVNANSNWQIPDGSKVKFSFESLGITSIDGKWA